LNKSRYFFIVLFIFLIFDSIAQSIVSGTLTDITDNKPVFGVNIIVKDYLDSTLLGYSISDNLGKFKVEIDVDSDSLLFVFNSMTIEKMSIVLPNISQSINLKMVSSIKELEEFTLEGIKNPISISNDTLSYSVEGFANQNDRVISDLLKRLPGIEVLENGMIRYEGLPLQKFYIDGLDLLEGRYNLANKNMPVDAVESIQILENHQPILVLDSLVFSDRASLNLKLKRKNTLIGTGNLGIGGLPFIWDTKVSPMFFNNKFQMLNTFQSNNIGEDIEQQLNVLTLENLKSFSNLDIFNPWSEVPRINTADINKEKFLFNKSFLTSLNILNKNQNQTESRFNLSFVYDQQDEFGDVQTFFFLPDDTVSIVEKKSNSFISKKLDSELTWTKNVKNYYLKNRLSFKLNHLNQGGNIILNDTLRKQFIEIPLFEIGNSLNIIKPVKNQLVNIRSDLIFRSSHQNFESLPGGFTEFLNNDVDFSSLNQDVFHQTFYNFNSIGITKALSKNWTYKPSLGFVFQADGMKSELGLTQNNNESGQLDYPFANDVSYTELKSFFNNELELKIGNLNLNLNIPFSYINIDVKDLGVTSNQNLSRILFEPNVFGKYIFNGKLNSSFSFRRKNDFRGIHQLHTGYILNNFRSFQQYATQIPESLDHTFSYYFNYRNPINSIFWTAQYSISRVELNTILQSQVIESGEALNSSLDLKNKREVQMVNVRGGKYFSTIYTNFVLSGSYTVRNGPQIINEKLTDVDYSQYGSQLELNINPKRNFGISSATSHNRIMTFLENQRVGKIRQLFQKTSLDVFPINNHLFRLDWEFYSNQIEGREGIERSSFLNMAYRVKFPKRRMDLSLKGFNLLNFDTFDTFSANTFLLTSQSFRLRPRQFIIEFMFSF
jgi:hypothetical protein